MKKKLKKHVFICQKCTFQGSKKYPSPANIAEQMRAKVKTLASKIWRKDEVRINKSGCLGQCEHGICSVIYPDGKWLLNLRPGDENKILKEIKSTFKD